MTCHLWDVLAFGKRTITHAQTHSDEFVKLTTSTNADSLGWLTAGVNQSIAGPFGDVRI